MSCYRQGTGLMQAAASPSPLSKCHLGAIHPLTPCKGFIEQRVIPVHPSMLSILIPGARRYLALTLLKI